MMHTHIGGLSSFRPRLHTWQFTLLLSVVLVAFYNRPLWVALLDLYQPIAGNLILLASFALFLVAMLNLLFSLVMARFLLKPVSVLLFVVTALVSYFMDTYGVMIDHTMVQNAFETHTGEALELISLKMLEYLLFLGVLPSLLVARVEIAYRPWTSELRLKAAGIGGSVVIIALIGLFLYQPFASLFRNNSHLRHLVTPTNYLYATAKYLTASAPANGRVEPVGTDAARGAYWTRTAKNKLLVLVVGETARADNFSLNGYGRPTDRYLAQEDIVSFTNVHSCGTSTAVSIPCMFSRLDRGHYSDHAAKRQENLLDVIAHAGVNVLWRDNNSGCKGVCDRIVQETSKAFIDPAKCHNQHCFDEAMLNGLDKYLARVDGDAVIALHQLGSHGPAYFQRYPSAFEAFTPVCGSNQLQDCAPQEIVNAYDNTILYTDYFLSRVITFLKAQSERYDAAMLYVSDHGESLGEHNLYLHGLPYFLAPEEQKHVPLITWLSDGYSEAFAMDRGCLRGHVADPITHDNLFHSILGLLDIHTAAYDSTLDIFSGCHRAPAHQVELAPTNSAKGKG